MATWRLTNKKEVECLATATKYYFRENTGTVNSTETLWEAYKVFIRGAIIAGEVGDRRKRKERIEQVEKHIKQLEEKYWTGADPQIKRELESKKEELHMITRE